MNTEATRKADIVFVGGDARMLSAADFIAAKGYRCAAYLTARGECGVRSIGMREFYQANASDFHPEATFILADYLDYDGETACLLDGQRYNILRTYRTGQELELTVERAPVEDGGVYG